MNFTTYDQGFSANGPMLSKPSSKEPVSRNQGLHVNPNSALIKSHQHIPNAAGGAYGASQIKPAVNQTQQKFFASKSPGQGAKLMASTNYGKFKAIPTQNPHQAYQRGPGIQTASGQYLPKLGMPSNPAGSYQAMLERQSSESRNNPAQQYMQRSNPKLITSGTHSG